MKRKTYFAFHIDVWTTLEIALPSILLVSRTTPGRLLAYRAAIQNRPKDKITLRQGTRVVMKNWTE
jgi:hypothetical protein